MAENIEFIILEDDEEQEVMEVKEVDRSTEIINLFNKKLKENSVVLNFKFNTANVDDEKINTLFDYVSSNSRIIASSCGEHFKGKLQKPHTHCVFILEQFDYTALKKYPTKSRQSFLKKQNLPINYFEGNLSMQVDTLDMNKPVYYPLCYPLKEGHMLEAFEPTWGFRDMDRYLIDFLLQVGTSLFAAKQSRDDAKDLREKVVCSHKQLILDFCRKNRGRFTDLKEMKKLVNDEYYKPIPFLEKPELGNVKKWCQIIGVELGIYSLELL